MWTIFSRVLHALLLTMYVTWLMRRMTVQPQNIALTTWDIFLDRVANSINTLRHLVRILGLSLSDCTSHSYGWQWYVSVLWWGNALPPIVSWKRQCSHWQNKECDLQLLTWNPHPSAVLVHASGTVVRNVYSHGQRNCNKATCGNHISQSLWLSATTFANIALMVNGSFRIWRLFLVGKKWWSNGLLRIICTVRREAHYETQDHCLLIFWPLRSGEIHDSWWL